MSEGVENVKEWILKRHPERTDITADEDLIENRLIDSLSFVEFVFLLEQLSGQSIDMDTLQIDSVRTLGTIEERFFSTPVS